MERVDLLVIGGGSAGMAAALQAKKEGVKDILILEKEDRLGGILNQCIHNGFGLTEFKEELSGPEYLQRFADQVIAEKIPYKLNTMVTNLSKNKVVTYSNSEDGIKQIQAKAVIMATGCYERNAGAIQLAGDRPSGIITAGTAQKYLNIHGYLVGKKIVILGSGDIGLIMARRLTLEGAKVICVSEINPYSAGLNRNIAQCLKDFDIPLYLSRTVSKVIGKNRVEKVVLTAVDQNYNFIPNTDMEIECDTLILSIGLVPYIELLEKIDCPTSSTKGAKVNSLMETEIDGVFACGNCLHVHDVVDFVTDEGRLAGHGAALYINDKFKDENVIKVNPGNNVSYVVPQTVNMDVDENVTFKFRVRKPLINQRLTIKSGENLLFKQVKPVLIPSEMVMISVPLEKLKEAKEEITLSLEDN